MSGTMNGAALAHRSRDCGIDTIGEQYFARYLPTVPRISKATILKFCTFPTPEEIEAAKKIERPAFRPVKERVTYRRVTPAGRKEIHRLWTEGKTPVQISAIVGRSSPTVRAVLATFGVTFNTGVPKCKQAEEMILRGLDHEAIAVAVDTSRKYVQRLASEMRRAGRMPK